MGTVRCILNGAFDRHQRKESYRKSRGIVLLDSFEFQSFTEFTQAYSLEDIEPFTLVNFEKKKGELIISEIRWNEDKVYFREFDSDQPHIWSARALYKEKQRAIRENWFWNQLSNKKSLNPREVLDFHTSRHGEDEYYDIMMKRSNGVATTSTSQITYGLHEGTIKYLDHKSRKDTLIDWQY